MRVSETYLGEPVDGIDEGGSVSHPVMNAGRAAVQGSGAMEHARLACRGVEVPKEHVGGKMAVEDGRHGGIMAKEKEGDWGAEEVGQYYGITQQYLRSS